MKITHTKNEKNMRITFRAGKLLLITGLSLMLTVSAFADPNDPGDDPDNTPVPFDGGISLLAAAGVGYGIKKWREARNEKNEPKAKD